MAEVNQEVKRQEAAKAADKAAKEKERKKALACDDEYDPGVEYMQVGEAGQRLGDGGAC